MQVTFDLPGGCTTTSLFLRLVDGRKRPWWIVGSLPHQKKPRLLVFHVSHMKENFSLLRFVEELLDIPPLLTPPATSPWDTWISLTRSTAGATCAHLPCEFWPPWSGHRITGDIGKWATCSMPGNGCFQEMNFGNRGLTPKFSSWKQPFPGVEHAAHARDSLLSALSTSLSEEDLESLLMRSKRFEAIILKKHLWVKICQIKTARNGYHCKAHPKSSTIELVWASQDVLMQSYNRIFAISILTDDVNISLWDTDNCGSLHFLIDIRVRTGLWDEGPHTVPRAPGYPASHCPRWGSGRCRGTQRMWEGHKISAKWAHLFLQERVNCKMVTIEQQRQITQNYRQVATASLFIQYAVLQPGVVNLSAICLWMKKKT